MFVIAKGTTTTKTHAVHLWNTYGTPIVTFWYGLVWVSSGSDSTKHTVTCSDRTDSYIKEVSPALFSHILRMAEFTKTKRGARLQFYIYLQVSGQLLQYKSRGS